MDNGSISTFSYELSKHSNYIGIPCYYRREFGRFGIKIGLQPKLFIKGSSKLKMNNELNGDPTETIEENNDLQLKLLDLRPKTGIDFRIKDNLRIRADFYNGLIATNMGLTNNLNQGSLSIRNRQFNLGLNYMYNK